MDLCQRPPGVGLWRELECVLCTFEDFDLSEDATDATIWHTCQEHDILMITGNRNAEGPESLEMTIRHRNIPNFPPVLTLADPDRIQRDRLYAEAVVERLFGFPFPNHVSKAACRERIVYRNDGPQTDIGLGLTGWKAY